MLSLFKWTKKKLDCFFREESGQGINEYAAMLAFVALLIICVFGFTQGSLTAGLSQSFSCMVGQVDRLATAAANN